MGDDASMTELDAVAGGRAPWRDRLAFVEGVEAGSSPAEWTYEGLDLWPMLRTSFLLRGNVNMLLGGRLGWRRRAFDALAPIASRLRITGIARRTAHGQVASQLPRADLLVCLFSASFQRDEKGCAFHPLAQPWLDAAARDGVSTLTLLIEGTAVPQPCSMAGPLRAMSPAALGARLTGRFPAPRFQTWADLDTFLRQSKLRFPESGLGVAEATLFAGRALLSRNGFEEILDHVRPKAVILQCAYALASWGLNAAARSRAIPLFDLQHGLQGPHHEAYALPAGRLAASNTLPGGYLTWGMPETSHLQSWVSRPDRVIASVPFRIASHLAAGRPLHARTPRSKPRILYLAHNGAALGAVQRLASEVADAFDLRIQLHPNDARRAAAEWKGSTDLMGELSEADAVVTGLSSAALEADAMGLPVLVHADYGRFLLQPVLGSDRAIYGPLSRESLERLVQQSRRDVDAGALTRRFEAGWAEFRQTIDRA